MFARKLELSGKWATNVWKEQIISRNQKAKQNTTSYFQACMSFAKQTDLTSSYINGRILGHILSYSYVFCSV